MIFRDVQLINAGKQSEENLAQNRYLMAYWENLRDIFCTLLPSKFDFYGISKLNIYLGPFEGENFTEASADGIAIYRRCDFDFSEFKKLPEQDKNERSLFYVRDSLLALCKRFELSDQVSEIIRKVSKQVLENNFELKREYKKTTKWNKARNLRAITELNHKVGGIDVNFTLVNKQGVTLAKHCLFSKAIWNTVWFELFVGTWEESNFIIENRVGTRVFTFNNHGEMVTLQGAVVGGVLHCAPVAPKLC